VRDTVGHPQRRRVRLGHAVRQEPNEHAEKVFPSLGDWHTLPSAITNPTFPVTGLHNLVQRVPPVVAKPTKEPAVFALNWLSATGSGILLAAILSGLVMGISIPHIFKIYGRPSSRCVSRC